MKTITLHSVQFVVRTSAVQTIKDMNGTGFRNIQELLVGYFNQVEDVLTDEYALLVAVYFKDSKAYQPACRQARCSADVRKYNKGEFKCQEEVYPDKEVIHIDGGARASKRDHKAAEEALKALD